MFCNDNGYNLLSVFNNSLTPSGLVSPFSVGTASFSSFFPLAPPFFPFTTLSSVAFCKHQSRISVVNKITPSLEGISRVRLKNCCANCWGYKRNKTHFSTCRYGKRISFKFVDSFSKTAQ